MTSGPPWATGDFSFAPDHPALAGHFPGDPIVPGVAVLQRVLLLMEADLSRDAPLTIAEARFVRALRPLEECTVVVWWRDRRFPFECRVRQDLVARGTVVLEEPG